MEDQHKEALCRLVGVLLVTDGQLTDSEYTFFNGLMERLNVEGEARSRVTGAVSVDTDIRPDVDLLREAGLAEDLLATLHDAADADGEIAKREDSLLAKIRALLDE